MRAGPGISVALTLALLLPAPARAGLGEDMAHCQSTVWPRFAGWSLSRQQGPDSPRTAEDFYGLALGHWSGQGPFPGKDPVQAARYAQTAAEQSHPGAQGLLGFFAAQGHPDSLNALASAYDNGQGVAVDKQEALRLYRQAAERGSKEAGQTLAGMQQPKGPQPGQPDFEEGVRLYKASQHAAAAKRFLRAAEMGNPRAQLRIGYQYQYGEGVPANAGEAVKWYAKAADQGDAAAQSNLGRMFEQGTGVREDWVEAARWYGKSPAQDHPAGLFSLGRAYQFGIGVPQNRKLAIEWFQKASFRGHAQARYFAQHLQSRGNFVGFRDAQEEVHVIAGKLRTGLLWEEPVGVLFRNSGERLAYIRNLRYRVGRYEAYQAWVFRKNEFDECKRANKSYCSDPGSPPQ